MDRVSFSHLSKRYGKVCALDDVSLSIGEGELFGLIGPDGAGKTTLMRILTSLILPDRGEALVDGLDPVRDFRALRRHIGYMPGRFSLYPDLTVEENLTFFAHVFHTTVRDNYELISDIYRHLEPFRHRRADKLSGGMKQKLALCCALVHRPRILFLDEPTTGVDAVSRQEFWEMLARIRAQSITIMASTPYMDEAARCDRIALMAEGRFLRVDTPHAVAAGFPHKLWGIRTDGMHRLLLDVRAFPGVRTAYSFGSSIHTTFMDTPTGLADYLRERGHGRIQIENIDPGVEDVFILLSHD